MNRAGFRTVLVFLVLSLCAALIVTRGIIPALTVIDTDFPNYYTAGSLVLSGKPASLLYDDAWFQQQSRALGMIQAAKFDPFPPVTALYSAPLALLNPLGALRLMTLVSIAALVGSVILLMRITARPPREAALIALVSGIGLANCFRFGQVYVLVSFSLLLGYWLFTRGRPVLAGVSFGLFLPLKYYPGIVVLAFLLHKEYRTLFAATITACVTAVAGVLVMGWGVHREFIEHVLGGHLAGAPSQQSPFAVQFQSFTSLFHRWFIFNAAENPGPLLNSPAVYTLALLIVACIVLAAAAIALGRRHNAFHSLPATVAVIGMIPLILAPASATYHGVLLWLPMALFLNLARETNQRGLLAAGFVFYAGIGFIPYSMLTPFANDGILALAAYPRLLLWIMIYSTMITAVWQAPARRSNSGEVSTPRPASDRANSAPSGVVYSKDIIEHNNK